MLWLDYILVLFLCKRGYFVLGKSDHTLAFLYWKTTGCVHMRVAGVIPYKATMSVDMWGPTYTITLIASTPRSLQITLGAHQYKVGQYEHNKMRYSQQILKMCPPRMPSASDNQNFERNFLLSVERIGVDSSPGPSTVFWT